MKWVLVWTTAVAMSFAQDARAQAEVIWRNYEPESRSFAHDSTSCRARVSPGGDTVLSPATPTELGKCVTALGWRSMQRVTIAPRHRCEAVEVSAAGRDASIAAALRESFARRFRPPSADAPYERYEIRAASTGLSGGVASAAWNGVVTSALPAIVRDVEYDIAPVLMTLRPGTVEGYRVTLRANCVSEFPYSGDAIAALAARGSSPLYFEFQVGKQAIQKPGSSAPSYPSRMRDAGIVGEVLAQFVVDTRGRVEPGTLTILVTTHEDFTEAVRKALPKMRFLPAENQGVLVRQLVQQPFGFAIAK